MTNPNEAEEQFSSYLDVLVHSIPPEDKIYFLGDFDANVWTNAETWPGIIQHNALETATAMAYCH